MAGAARWGLLVALIGLSSAIDVKPPSVVSDDSTIRTPDAPRAINLLSGAEPLQLWPDDFETTDKACTTNQVLRARYPGLALPLDSSQAVTLALDLQLDCSSLAGRAAAPAEALLSLRGVDVGVDCGRGLLVLTGAVGGGGQLAFPLNLGGASSAGPVNLTLQLTLEAAQQGMQQQAAALCAGGRTVAPLPFPPLAYRLLLGPGAPLPGGGVVLGARSDAQRGARAALRRAWLLDARMAGCFDPVAPPWQGLERSAEANALPEVAELQQAPAGDVEVGDSVAFAVQAADSDGDDLNLSLTFYGLSKPGCRAAECGDLALSAAGRGGRAEVKTTVSYPKPGRYVIRVQVSDMWGRVVTRDHALLARKRGDGAGRRAPCCRHTAHVSGQQTGRPVHESRFRDKGAWAQAAALGWSRDYWENEDLEAERLFDFGLLAPPVGASPLELLTCHDRRLAGAGSPVVPGSLDANRPAVSGHGKRLVVVPEAFPWAAAADVACQSHWSGWQRNSPYAVEDKDRVVCSTGCTRNGTLQMMEQTGMFDQYAQAMAAASYGRLSLSPEVVVLPEVPIARDYPAYDNFAYYEEPARKALAASGEPYWLHAVLAPLANHRVPSFRAWSGGPTTQDMVVTQCYATMYYFVHETGHRLGFHHANMYRLDDAVSSPADPLGSGSLTTSGYGDQLDIMACCKSDYSLYHRSMAGWLAAAERRVLAAGWEGAAAAHSLTLWPFDRAESRGQLMSVAVRRSANEVLLIGFRSASHWQDVALASAGGPGPLAPEAMRANVAGLSVEYVRRDGPGAPWSEKGLLDLNVLHGDWPSALPAAPGAAAARSQFALLKEGSAWYDAPSGTLVALRYVSDCGVPAPGVQRHNYAARGFFGFRGEWPRTEAFQLADYTGFQSLPCARLLVRTNAPPPPVARLRLQLAFSNPPPASQQSSQAAAAGRRLRQAADGCAALPAAPLATLRLPTDGTEIEAVVWKDALNRTFFAGAPAPGQRELAVLLPPPLEVPLPASAARGGAVCAGAGCPGREYSLHVLAADGRHARAHVALLSASLAGTSLAVRTKRYGQSAAEGHSYEEDAVQLPAPLGAGGATPRAVVLYRGPGLPLAGGGAADQEFGGLPATACGRQWTATALLRLAAPAAQQSGSILSMDSGRMVVGLGAGQAARRALLVRSGAAELALDLPGSAQLTDMHLVLAGDGGRLGAWVNGQGGWLMDGSAAAAYHQPTSIRLGAPAVGEGAPPLDASLQYLRFYPFVVPLEDLPLEADASGEHCAYLHLPCGAENTAGNKATVAIVAGAVAGALVLKLAVLVGCLVWRRRRARAAARGRVGLEEGAMVKSEPAKPGAYGLSAVAA